MLTLGVTTLLLQWKDRPADSRIEQCRQAHDVPASPPELPADPSAEELAALDHKVWADCAWPPFPGAGKDGYWRVEVDRVQSGDSMAELITADLFKSDCLTLVVRYQHTQQGIVATWDFTVANDQVVSMEFRGQDDKPQLVPASLPSSIEGQTGPRQSGLSVLTAANFGLARSACSAQAAP